MNRGRRLLVIGLGLWLVFAIAPSARVATDPAAAIDVPHYCAESGHALLSTEQRDGLLIFAIRKTHGS